MPAATDQPLSVIPYFYPAMQYGGQPRSAFELAHALVKRGHRVKVLTTDSAAMPGFPLPTSAKLSAIMHCRMRRRKEESSLSLSSTKTKSLFLQNPFIVRLSAEVL